MNPRSRRQAARPRPQPRASGPWKHGPIPVIGVVGGIGSGKSAVASHLETLGGFVIDADAVGHALLAQRPVRDEVVARFGPGIVMKVENGSPPIDRRVLAAIVFRDPKARRDLESILHPRMRRTFERAIARTVRRGRSKAVVLDAAVLYEARWDALCDRVVFVDAPRDLRLARVEASRGWTDEVLQAREQSQLPFEEKKARADVVVANAGDLAALGAEVTRAWESMRRPAGSVPGARRVVTRPTAAEAAEPRTPDQDA